MHKSRIEIAPPSLLMSKVAPNTTSSAIAQSNAASDGKLLALCAEFQRHWASEQEAAAALAALPEDFTKAQRNKHWDALNRHQARAHKAAFKIHKITPTTTAGVAAKAVVVFKEIEDFGGEDTDPGLKLAHRFIQDLLGFLRPSGAGA